MRLLLGKKISISIVITVLFFGSLATGVVFVSVQRVILDLEKDSLVTLVNETTNEISRVLSNSKLVVATIAEQQEVQDFLLNPVGQDGEILKLLNRYNIGDNFSAIYLISRTGKTLASTDATFNNKNYSFRKYFTEAIAGRTFVDVAVGVTSGELGYYISVPIRNNNAEILGVAAVKLIPEAISQLVHTSRLTNFGHVMLTDNFGVIIFSDVNGRMLKSLGGLGDYKRKEIEKLQKYPGVSITALDYDVLVDYFDQSRQSGIIEIYDKIDKKQEILAYSQVADLPFYLIYEEEIEDFSLSATKVSLLLSFFVFITAIMTMIVVAVFVKKILLPLSDIMLILKNVGSGNLKNKIRISSDDELRDLANVFNDMIDSVREEKENIEDKILKRTKELEVFNNLMVGREVKMIELKRELEEVREGVKASKRKTWAEKFKDASDSEEGLIRDLESVYLYKIKRTDLSTEKKEKVIKLIKKLVSDSKRHGKVFIKLLQEDE